MLLNHFAFAPPHYYYTGSLFHNKIIIKIVYLLFLCLLLPNQNFEVLVSFFLQSQQKNQYNKDMIFLDFEIKYIYFLLYKINICCRITLAVSLSHLSSWFLIQYNFYTFSCTSHKRKFISDNSKALKLLREKVGQ